MLLTILDLLFIDILLVLGYLRISYADSLRRASYLSNGPFEPWTLRAIRDAGYWRFGLFEIRAI